MSIRHAGPRTPWRRNENQINDSLILSTVDFFPTFAALAGIDLPIESPEKYFDGQDLNGDGTPDNGLTMHLQAGQQGMFHFMSFSAPFVIGPDNPNLYWFDPADM